MKLLSFLKVSLATSFCLAAIGAKADDVSDDYKLDLSDPSVCTVYYYRSGSYSTTSNSSIAYATDGDFTAGNNFTGANQGFLIFDFGEKGVDLKQIKLHNDGYYDSSNSSSTHQGTTVFVAVACPTSDGATSYDWVTDEFSANTSYNATDYPQGKIDVVRTNGQLQNSDSGLHNFSISENNWVTGSTDSTWNDAGYLTVQSGGNDKFRYVIVYDWSNYFSINEVEIWGEYSVDAYKKLDLTDSNVCTVYSYKDGTYSTSADNSSISYATDGDFTADKNFTSANQGFLIFDFGKEGVDLRQIKIYNDGWYNSSNAYNTHQGTTVYVAVACSTADGATSYDWVNEGFTASNSYYTLSGGWYGDITATNEEAKIDVARSNGELQSTSYNLHNFSIVENKWVTGATDSTWNDVGSLTIRSGGGDKFRYVIVYDWSNYFYINEVEIWTAAEVSNGGELTSCSITNPSFEKGNTSGWTVDESMSASSESTEGMTDSYLLHCNSSDSEEHAATQTITLPAGSYVLSADVLYDYTADGNTGNLGNATLSAGNDSTEVSASEGKFVKTAVQFSLSEADEVEIGVSRTGWFKADNFQLFYFNNDALAASKYDEIANIKSVDVSATAGKYVTRIFPFTPSLPEGMTTYSCSGTVSGSEATLDLTKVSNLAANVPYILYSENGVESTTLSASAAPIETSYTEGWLTGVMEETYVPAGNYVLQTQNGTQGFYYVSQDNSIAAPAYRAYLTVPSTISNARVFNFSADDATTAVETIEALTSDNPEIYDLSGRKLSKLQKGVNIVNGHKVIVK